MLHIILMCVLSFAVTDPVAPTIKVPAEVKAQPSTITELRADTNGKTVVWVVLTPGLSVRPVDGGRTLLFTGPPGRYECLAYTALADVPSGPGALRDPYWRCSTQSRPEPEAAKSAAGCASREAEGCTRC